MNIQPEELAQNKYVLLDELKHMDLIPFVRTYLGKRTKYYYLYIACNAVAFFMLGVFFMQCSSAANSSMLDSATNIGTGVFISFLLMPLHEYLHVLAYKSMGAKNTSYDANLKKFYFMALADRFVADKKEFAIIALTPFIVISSILVLGIIFLPICLKVMMSSTLVFHTSMCSGDFGILNYFEFNKDKDIVTYDNVPNKISYFYGKESEK